ncbi:MAG: hypothetical protein QOE70_913 [Chthoniobacter sp.]|nr:hypothetical protein [Chthoniobacter sp.]
MVVCTDAISDIHLATDERVRQITARRYYGTLFIMWFGTQERNGSKIFELDMRDYIRGFLGAAEREHFASLLNYDDPLGWTHVPADINRQDMIDVIAGMPYSRWVLEQMKDPAAYKDSVRRFRELMATVRPNE